VNRQGATIRLHAGSGATRDELLQAVLDAIAQIETSGFRLQ